MNALNGSIDVSATSGFPEPGGWNDRGSGIEHDAPSRETARELYDDALRAARKRLLMVVAAPIAVAAVIYIMANDPVLGWILAGPTIALVATAFGAAREWWRLRGVDPLEYWHRERSEELQSAQALIDHQRRILEVTPIASYSHGAVVAAVTLVQFFGPGVESSISLAALVKPAVRAGEWWRLLSASMLHANLWHLVANLGGLVVLGTLIEAYDRPARVPLLFLAGAIGASVTSTLLVPEGASVGASGGVLGLLGYLLVTGVGSATSRGMLRKDLLTMLMMTAGTGLVGFFFIDNAGHAGGAAAGGATGAIAVAAGRIGGEWPRRLDAAGYASSAILLAGAVFTIGRLLRSW